LDFWTEGVWVALQNGFHRRLPYQLILMVVEAVGAVAVLAVTAARKTLAVPVCRVVSNAGAPVLISVFHPECKIKLRHQCCTKSGKTAYQGALKRNRRTISVAAAGRRGSYADHCCSYPLH
jgi:hypothetical protein